MRVLIAWCIYVLRIAYRVCLYVFKYILLHYVLYSIKSRDCFSFVTAAKIELITSVIEFTLAETKNESGYKALVCLGMQRSI